MESHGDISLELQFFFIFIAYVRNPTIIIIIIIILFFVIFINTIIINLTCYRIGKPGKTMCKKTETHGNCEMQA